MQLTILIKIRISRYTIKKDIIFSDKTFYEKAQSNYYEYQKVILTDHDLFMLLC